MSTPSFIPIVALPQPAPSAHEHSKSKLDEAIRRPVWPECLMMCDNALLWSYDKAQATAAAEATARMRRWKGPDLRAIMCRRRPKPSRSAAGDKATGPVDGAVEGAGRRPRPLLPLGDLGTNTVREGSASRHSLVPNELRETESPLLGTGWRASKTWCQQMSSLVQATLRLGCHWTSLS